MMCTGCGTTLYGGAYTIGNDGMPRCGPCSPCAQIPATGEVERLRAELARERALRASTGCVCATRLVGRPAVCVYLADGTGSGAARIGDDRASVARVRGAGHHPAMQGGTTDGR